MKIGISLPVREFKNDLVAIKDFAPGGRGSGLDALADPGSGLAPRQRPPTRAADLARICGGFHAVHPELVPSVIVLPSRQTALFAKQAAEVDVLSQGRLRLGIGVGKSAEEYAAMGADFHTRGARCEEQMRLLKALWTQPSVEFSGRWDTIEGVGIDPLPVQRPIPMWIGASGVPVKPIVRRIGRLADGWFVLCGPEEFPSVDGAIRRAAKRAGRDPGAIGTEAGVAVVGPREHEWQARVAGWRQAGLTHLCLRTLGGNLAPGDHVPKMREAAAILAQEGGLRA